MFQFSGFASSRLCVQRVIPAKAGGFPHSEILGSKPVAGSPRHIAGCHVLHRLLPPRHPPCALSCLSYTAPNVFRVKGQATDINCEMRTLFSAISYILEDMTTKPCVRLSIRVKNRSAYLSFTISDIQYWQGMGLYHKKTEPQVLSVLNPEDRGKLLNQQSKGRGACCRSKVVDYESVAVREKLTTSVGCSSKALPKLI